jgi:predicted permease
MRADFRSALRLIARNPAFTVTAVTTLAIGIAVNTIVFTLIDALVLRPMPVRGADRIVRIYPVDARGRRQNLFSIAEYQALRDSSIVGGLVAYVPLVVTLGGDEPQDLLAYAVSDNYLSVLGIDPALGRTFGAPEARGRDGSAVAIISDRFWARHFGSDRAAVGSTIRLNGRTVVIVGIGPSQFMGTEPLAPDVWIPLTLESLAFPGVDPSTVDDVRSVLVLGRLARGDSNPSIARAMTTVVQNRAGSMTEPERTAAIRLERGTFFTIDPALRPLIALVTGAVALLLLIACANIANLVLARAVSRQREIAVRLALGAHRWQVVRQLVIESTVVAIIGGAGGLLISGWTLRLLYPIGLSLVPFQWASVVLDLTPDWRVFLFTLLLALVAGVAFGLGPALQASSPVLVSALHDDAPVAGTGVRRSRLRNALAVAQIALCMILLVGSALLARGLRRAEALDVGFRTSGVMFADFDPVRQGYTAARARQFSDDLAQRATRIPGVTAVGVTSHVPLTGGIRRTRVEIGGRAPEEWCNYAVVSPGYFATLDIPIVAGRNFTGADSSGNPPVAIVSAALARRFWPGETVLGRTVTSPAFGAVTVVGIVRDASDSALWREKELAVYLPAQSRTSPGHLSLIMHTNGDPLAAASALRTAARTLDRDLRVTVMPLADVLQLWILPSRVAAIAGATLGGLAVVLAAVGLYGVLAYLVSRRTREIGIRIALGADRRDVYGLVLADAARLIAIGLGLGLIGALAATRLLAGLLFGVSESDPLTFAAVSVFLVFVAFCAVAAPARRATRVDPITALRVS